MKIKNHIFIFVLTIVLIIFVNFCSLASSHCNSRNIDNFLDTVSCESFRSVWLDPLTSKESRGLILEKVLIFSYQRNNLSFDFIDCVFNELIEDYLLSENLELINSFLKRYPFNGELKSKLKKNLEIIYCRNKTTETIDRTAYKIFSDFLHSRNLVWEGN